MCEAISILKKQKQEQFEKATTFQTTTTVKTKAKLVDLVGERCIIDCWLEKKAAKVLLDTGAQVSIVNQQYLEEMYPSMKIRQLDEILDDGDSLRVQWGNSTEISFVG